MAGTEHLREVLANASDAASLPTERRRDPDTGRFVPSEAMQARRDGTA